MIHHNKSAFCFAAAVAGDGDIALQGEDRTARVLGPLTLRQYRIAAFLNTSRQQICNFTLCQKEVAALENASCYCISEHRRESKHSRSISDYRGHQN